MATPNRFEHTGPKSWAPTRKWLVARITAASALAVMYVTTGGWDAEETIALIGLLTESALSYLTPNENTPGGVPTKPVGADDYV